MGQENFYEDIEMPPIIYEVGVKEANKFIETMLNFFMNKGVLYINSWDLVKHKDRLEKFKSDARVTQKGFLFPSFLKEGYNLNKEFVDIFNTEFLKNIDAKKAILSFEIYQKGYPLVQCYDYFEDVFVNVAMPQHIIDGMLQNKIVSSWEEVPPDSKYPRQDIHPQI